MMMMMMRPPLLSAVLLLACLGTVQGQSGPPSMMPSETPSAAPVTNFPTGAPTMLPSNLPTRAPTGMPVTLAPTSAPTGQPTSGPTGQPTAVPTTVPTSVPTSVPSFLPTSVPTSFPTAAPVANTTAPTVTVTAAPTMAPTSMPTVNNDTLAPTSRPTMFPTLPFNETAVPTAAPNVTEAPTSAPTMMDKPGDGNLTTTPTGTPTSMPTAAPTSAPAPVGTPVDETITGIQITLTGVGNLDATAQTVFVSTTATFYRNLYPSSSTRRRQLQAVEGISDFDTSISYRGQSVGADANTITYDQRVTYVSTTTATATNVILEPFSDAGLADTYLFQLQANGGATFANLTGVTAPFVVDDREEDDGGGGLSAGAIGGIVAGAVVAMAIVACIIMRASGGEDRGYVSGNDEELPTRNFSPLDSEEVSTIDDLGIGKANTNDTGSLLDVGDQSVATVDYDYSKAYGGADNSVVSSAGGTLGDNTRETGSALQTSARAALGASFDSEGKPDANVQEEVIEINAPAGKLGVVIDTPDEGAPVVHAVKDSSVIADLIQVGDKLVAVDDEDVTTMTAIKVSKLISKKSGNPSRKLTVIRRVLVED